MGALTADTIDNDMDMEYVPLPTQQRLYVEIFRRTAFCCFYAYCARIGEV